MKATSTGGSVTWSRAMLYGFLMLFFLAFSYMLIELEFVTAPDAAPADGLPDRPMVLDEAKYGSAKRVVHVVSHTHWDREWYMPFEAYRRRFVLLLDEVMDRLQRDPERFNHFHMDGQVIPFIDYFEVRPQARASVLRAVREGRLSIGPWYTAPDEFLASPESLVRNIQNGLRHCRRMGVEDRWTRVGYMADTFGHVSQIPQIYRLFGIDNAVFARGVRNADAEMEWTGPDGSKVFCVYMVKWYCNAEGSPATGGARWIKGKADQVATKSKSKHVLLMSGCDHTAFDPHILKAMSEGNAASDGAVYVSSSLEHFVDVTRKATAGKSLRGHRGEMRDGIEGLSHINSNKITQKQANWECMTLLEHYAEPMRAILHARGAMDDYNSDFIWYAWEKILENHAHDSIGGCSVTDVHVDVDHRFHRCVQVGRQMVDEALMALSRHAAPAADAPGGGSHVAVFNTLGHARADETVVVRLDSQGRVGDSPVVVDSETGEEVPAEVLHSEGAQWDFTMPDHGFRRPMRVTRTWVAFSTGAAGVPPLGHKTFHVRSMTGGTAGAATGVPAGGTLGAMENEHVRATVGADGRLTLEDKASGEKYPGLCRLVVQPDSGDEYKSQPGGMKEATKASAGKCVRGPSGDRCSAHVELPTPGGSSDATVVYLLPRGSRQVQIRVSLVNHRDNFRLRAHFSPGGDKGSLVSEADSHFDVVERPLSSPREERPQQDFVTLRSSDGRRGLTVGNRGLPGYEIEGGAAAVTLMRAVSKMSDWASFPTAPSSQEHGRHHFDLSVAAFSRPDGERPGSHEDAHAFNVPLAAVHMLNYPGVVNSKPLFDLRNSLLRIVEFGVASGRPTTTSFPPANSGGGGGKPLSYSAGGGGKFLGTHGSAVTVEPAHRLTVSSVKISESRDYTKADGGTLIVRWFHHGGSDAADAVVCFPNLDVAEAHLVNLREDRLEQLEVDAGKKCLRAPVKTRPKEIRTVELVFRPRSS